MKGTRVMVSQEPRGRKVEGTISGTLLPGTIVQIKAATEPVNGLFTWSVYNRDASGERPAGPIGVLLERGEGYTYATAYTDGDQCFVYIPLPGDEVNILWTASGTATSDSVAIGDLGIIEDATGLIIDTTGTPESEPFVACETLSDVVAAGTMCHSMYTGH